jgi:predicted aldo/keto reductase-like oxidoreductase
MHARETDFLFTTLGRTGRCVHRLGVASSYGIGGRDVEEAVEEHGVNYLYWGSFRTARFGRAIRALCRRGHRDNLFIVVQSYSRLASLVRPSLRAALAWLRIEQADLLLLGLWNSPVWNRVVAAAEACRVSGMVRHLGVSTHQRTLVPDFAGASPFDVVHLRYNAANRGAEQEVFPHVGSSDRAGLVAFTATRWGKLLRCPAGAPHDMRIPAAGDCYRFVLSAPSIDLCMTGPRNGHQLRQALAEVTRGPMSADELAWMRQFGDRVYGRSQ